MNCNIQQSGQHNTVREEMLPHICGLSRSGLVEDFCEQCEQQFDCQLFKKDIFTPRGLLFFLCVGFDVCEQTGLYSGSECCALVTAQQLMSSALRSVVLS